MEYKIEGDNLQVVRINLIPGEEIYAEAGKMVYKTSNVTMESKMIGSGLGEKIFGALKRKVAGESLLRRELGILATRDGGERSGLGAISDLVGGIFSSDG